MTCVISFGSDIHIVTDVGSSVSSATRVIAVVRVISVNDFSFVCVTSDVCMCHQFNSFNQCHPSPQHHIYHMCHQCYMSLC